MTTSNETIHPELVTEALAIVNVRDKLAATELLAAAQLTAEQVTSFDIVDDASFGHAGEALKALKGVQKRLETVRTAMKAPVLDAGRRIDAFFKAPTATLEQAERTIKGRVAAYQAEETRKRREAEEAARRERERLERERAEAARRDAEEKAGLSAEEREAAAARDVLAPPAHVLPLPTPAPLAPAPRVAGVSTRTVVKARVVDVRKVAHAAAHGDTDALALLAVDTAALNRLVRELGTELSIPGIEVYEEQVVSARSA